jgi:hypothetical protein
MATAKQKAAARRNIARARTVQSRRARGARIPKTSSGLSTRQENRMRSGSFAFPKKRKEPLTDARHVRNAIARFDQVEGVSDAERDSAWRRIRAAARKFGVVVTARGWRGLLKGGKTGRPKTRRATTSRSASRKPARSSSRTSSRRTTRTSSRRATTRSSR